MKTIHDPRYANLIRLLREKRQAGKVSQTELASRLEQPQSYVAKIEKLERRLDLIELLDWLTALGYQLPDFLRDCGWLTTETQSL